MKIGIVGLGYVGLPLAVAFSQRYDVVCFDINEARVDELKSHYDRTLEIDTPTLQDSPLQYTCDINDLKECSIYIVTVPTPIDKSNRPDLFPIENSTKMISRILKKDDIVIYESTVYPGVTEEVCVPILEEGSGLIFNQDFYCGYSPERINPGDKEHTVTKILKVTSGSTPAIAKKVDELYRSIITAGTFMASSIKVAEASKVIENTQRDVNIALINELALIFDTMGIDTNEVIAAASTKWNFIKLHPGLVGGHCIGVDPYYLTHKAEEMGYTPNLILASRIINNSMGSYISQKCIKLLIQNDKKVKNADVLILGLTFKEDCPDIRNTKVVDIIEDLKEFGCLVDVYDPWVDLNEHKRSYKHGVIENPFKSSKQYDAIIVTVGHKQFKALKMSDYESISKDEALVLDIKGIVEKPSWRL